ncbi:MAG: hypothetical protein ACREJL_01025 [Candidatus Methylomirabilales bacterium]
MLAFFLTPIGMFAITTHEVVYAVDLEYGRLTTVTTFGVLGP